MKKIFSNKKALTVLIPAALALSSCTDSDISAAQNFGEVSTQLGELNAGVSKDIYESCARSSTWLARGTSTTRNNMRNALMICDGIFRPNAERTEMAGNLLVEYVQSISTLATEDRETVSTRLENIGEALNGLSEAEGSSFQLNSNAVDTGVMVATFLINILLRDFRRQTLKPTIICTDPSIQSYSTDLANFIEKLYVQELLDEEINSVTRYFGGYRSPLTNTTNMLLESGSPAVFTSLQNTQMARDEALRNEITKIVERKNVGATYAALIRETAAAHTNLKLIFNDGEEEISPELEAQCDVFFAEEASSTDNIEVAELEAFNQPISQSELSQAREVVKAYTEKVQILMKEIK